MGPLGPLWGGFGSKPSRATAAFLAGAFFFTQKTTFWDFQVCGRRAGGGWHAGLRESLSLLLSLHSLHISHTQNRYPALRGDQSFLV